MSDSTADVVGRFQGQRILVVGDVILDEFVWGRVDRISPEAPVPIVEVSRETVHLGGAANVAANLALLGAVPRLVGVRGCDEPGERLARVLSDSGIDAAGVVQSADRTTTVKTRIIAHHQQVCRTDRESRTPVSGEERKQLRERCEAHLDEAAAVILSDYAKGVLDAPLIEHLIARCRKEGRFLAVDPRRGAFDIYRGASVITPNTREVEGASGLTIRDEESLVEAGRLLIDRTSLDYLLITRGEEGMTLFEGRQPRHIPTAAREVFDVTGAGDTVIASFCLAVASGASIRQAAVVANHAAGVVVGKLGTACASPGELLESLHEEK